MFAINVSGGDNALVQLHATEIISNSHAGSNFMRSMVYSGPRQSIELKGLNSETHLNGEKLSFLARLSEDETDLMRSRLTLIHLKQTTDRRVVSVFSQNVFGGQKTRQYEVVPVTKTDVADGMWVKLTPEKPLEPGEYGIIIMPKDPSFTADAVYDFNVDFSAASATKTGTK